jgi:hypothetical protein
VYDEGIEFVERLMRKHTVLQEATKGKVMAAVDSAMETWDTQRSKLRSMQVTGASRRRRITNQLAMSPTESPVPDDGSSDESTNGALRMRPDRNGVPLARVWANFDPQSQPMCFPHGTPIILEGYPVMSVEAGEVLLCEFSHGKRKPIAMMGPSVFWLMRRLCDVGDPKAKVCTLLSCPSCLSAKSTVAPSVRQLPWCCKHITPSHHHQPTAIIYLAGWVCPFGVHGPLGQVH